MIGDRPARRCSVLGTGMRASERVVDGFCIGLQTKATVRLVVGWWRALQSVCNGWLVGRRRMNRGVGSRHTTQRRLHLCLLALSRAQGQRRRRRRFVVVLVIPLQTSLGAFGGLQFTA
jgi:hypothetical protein